MKKFLMVVLAGAALLAGCGRSDKEGIDQPGKKIFYAPLDAKVTGLDPMIITDVYSGIVAGQCYEGLYQYHFLKNPDVIIPCLAEGMPEVSKDRLTWTIKLRKDVYYIDDKCFPDGKGRQIRAEDCVYGMKRIANVHNISPNWSGWEKRIVGLDEFREYTKTVKNKDEVDYSRSIEGLKALDNFTLQIKLVKPYPQMKYAIMGFTPIPKEAVDYYKDQFMNVAIGTGPFMIKSYKPASRVELVRNPKFRKEYYPTDGRPGDKEKGLLKDAGKPLPLLDGIVYYVIEEDQPYWLSLMQGKIDAGRVPKDFFGQVVTSDRKATAFLDEKGLNLLMELEPTIFWVGFNMEDPVIARNLPLRRAMSMAFNRKEYIDIFRNGLGYPAKGIFAPNINEYDPDLKNPWCEYNLEAAKKLMVEAEKINGGKVRLAIAGPTSTFQRQIMEYFKRNMARIGVEITTQYYDWPTYLEKLNKKLHQLFMSGVGAGTPDGIGALSLFYGPYESPGPNAFNYHNPKYDELYRKVEVMDESPERTRLYRLMEKMICDDCPAVLDEHRIRTYPYYRYVRNFKYNVFNNNPSADAKYFDIDLELRKKLVGR